MQGCAQAVSKCWKIRSREQTKRQCSEESWTEASIKRTSVICCKKTIIWIASRCRCSEHVQHGLEVLEQQEQELMPVEAKMRQLGQTLQSFGDKMCERDGQLRRCKKERYCCAPSCKKRLVQRVQGELRDTVQKVVEDEKEILEFQEDITLFESTRENTKRTSWRRSSRHAHSD